MPRLVNTLPKYRLHRASGQAVVTLAGVDHYLGKHGTKASRAKYDRLVGEWIAQGRPDVLIEPSGDLQIDDLVLAYWEHAHRYYVKDGHVTDEVKCVRTALRPLRELYGESPAAEFTPAMLKTVRERMVQSGWCRRHINKQVCRIRQMFRWGVAEGLVPVGVHQSLQTLDALKKGRTDARERPPVRPVPDDRVNATLPHLDDTLRAMVQVQRLTGMRPEEVCRLAPGQIDRSGDVWLYNPRRHKTEHHDKGRVIPIGPKAQAVLLPFLLRADDDYCFVPDPRKTHRGYYTTDGYRLRIRDACRRAYRAPKGLDAAARAAWEREHRWHPNQLRHAAGTEFRAKFGVEAARTLLGHTQLSTTEIYAERDLELATKIAREVG